MEDLSFTREQILLFARYEFHQGKPVEEAYQKFCEILGNDAMTYNDFDYWFYRFKNGQFELDYDRNKDPKKPGLLDIPVDVVEMIIGKLTLEAKLSLRKVSQRLRETVDNMKYTVEDFWLTDGGDYWLTHDNECVNLQYWEQALKVFLIMMNWPKMKVEKLDISVDSNEPNATPVFEFFEALNHQISVAEFHIFPQRVDQILTAFPYLKPKILERIFIHFEFDDEGYINLDEVVKLDHWKQAKVLHAYCVELPFESLYHAEEIKISVRNMSIDEISKLKNALLASSCFDHCDVTVYDADNERAIWDAFEDEIITIPETNQLFETKTNTKYTISFKKTTA